jgi:hypothetical protein
MSQPIHLGKKINPIANFIPIKKHVISALSTNVWIANDMYRPANFIVETSIPRRTELLAHSDEWSKIFLGRRVVQYPMNPIKSPSITKNQRMIPLLRVARSDGERAGVRCVSNLKSTFELEVHEEGEG